MLFANANAARSGTPLRRFAAVMVGGGAFD
jgi:hypothetical protein